MEKETLTLAEQSFLDRAFDQMSSCDPWDYSQEFIDFLRKYGQAAKRKSLAAVRS